MKKTLFVCILLSPLAFSGCGNDEALSEQALQLYSEAKEKYAEGSLHEAEEVLRTLAAEAPDFLQGRFMLAKTVFFREKGEAAVSLLRTILEENPKYREAELFLIRILIIEEQYEEAASRTDRLLSHDSEDPRLLHFRGMIYEQTGSLAKAMEYYRKAALSCEGYARIFLDLGRIYYIFDMPDSALVHLEKCSLLLENTSPVRRSVDRLIEEIERRSSK